MSLFPGKIGIDFANQLDALFGSQLKSDRLIIDLRGNPGGGIGGLTLMSYLTPERLPIGYSKNRKMALEKKDPSSLPVFDKVPRSKLAIPLLALKFLGKTSVFLFTEGLGRRAHRGRTVILVNEHTTGAAEMVAQFAQQNGLATIVGTQTSGMFLAPGFCRFLPATIATRTLPAVLRRLRWNGWRIAGELRLSRTTVSRILRRAGLNRLRSLDLPPPAIRYEHKRLGDLIHFDIKRLARIVQPGHRVLGDRTRGTRGAGYEYLHIAIDDHPRISFSAILPDETHQSAVRFFLMARAHYARFDFSIRLVLTDNGSCYRHWLFRKTLWNQHVKHRFTRIYTPRTNGKAERFIQTALREWAYARSFAAAIPAVVGNCTRALNHMLERAF